VKVPAKEAIMRIRMALLLAALALPAFAADELPAFRAGLWEFKRSVDSGDGKPAVLTNQKCANPTEDMENKTESMMAAGCKPTPITKRGNLYSFSLKCKLQGVVVQSRSVITVESDSAYNVDAESKQGSKTTREQLFARRIGNCPETQP
jgi:Protein of unknown function (DUF3617)